KGGRSWNTSARRTSHSSRFAAEWRERPPGRTPTSGRPRCPPPAVNKRGNFFEPFRRPNNAPPRGADMKKFIAVDIDESIRGVRDAGKGRRVLWQDSESIAFLSRGRKLRTDFHVDPSDEVTLQIAGEQRLHYLTPEGEEKIALIRPGQMLLCPG